MRKVRHIISKAQIKPGHRVLEIGSGWGTLAITIARTIPGTQIDSVTLSTAQRDLAMERIRKEGLEDRIRIHLMDYRSMPESWKASFDRLVSVEMMEAVGREYMDTFWKQMNWALKPKSGVGVVQCITLPETRTLSSVFPTLYLFLNHTAFQVSVHTATTSILYKNGSVFRQCSSMIITLTNHFHSWLVPFALGSIPIRVGSFRLLSFAIC